MICFVERGIPLQKTKHNVAKSKRANVRNKNTKTYHVWKSHCLCSDDHSGDHANDHVNFFALPKKHPATIASTKKGILRMLLIIGTQQVVFSEVMFGVPRKCAPEVLPYNHKFKSKKRAHSQGTPKTLQSGVGVLINFLTKRRPVVIRQMSAAFAFHISAVTDVSITTTLPNPSAKYIKWSFGRSKPVFSAGEQAHTLSGTSTSL